MKIVPQLIALGLMAAPAWAQTQASDPVTAGRVLPDVQTQPVFPRMIIQKGEKDQSVVISKAEVQSRVMGPLCETIVTMTFHNPNNRVLEGELYYPLPQGAVMQGYALDINGAMVDGVPVTKEKARVVFEEEQRRGIDPGLVEWSGGNQFKTRVHPIPANGTRTVRLRYTTMLPKSEDGSVLYQLPLNFGNRMDSFKLRVEVLNDEKPQINQSPVENLSFDKVQGMFVAEKELKDIALTEDLKMSIPTAQPSGMPCVEKHDGKYYAALAIPVEMEADAVHQAPSVLSIVWDASGSMAKADTAKAIAFLESYLKAHMNPAAPDRAVKEVKLTVVRNAVGEPQVFRDAESLIKELKAMAYDGATADVQSAIPSASDAGLCFVVSDGMSNFSKVEQKNATAPVVALAVASASDFHALERMKSRVLNLTNQTVEQALKSLDEPVSQVKGIYLDGELWRDAVCSSMSVNAGDTLLVTGVIPEGEHKVSVSWGNETNATELSSPVATAEAAEGTLLKSFHAQNRLNEMMREPETPVRAERLKALGEEYGIVTPGTSLLVLESLDQYIRHGVRPPASAPKERKLYDEHVAKNAKDKELSEESQRVAQMRRSLDGWKEKVKWLETDFKKNEQTVESHQGQGERTVDVNGLLSSIPENRRNSDDLAVLANGYYELGQFDEAAALYRHILERDAQHSAARAGLEAVRERRAAYGRQAHNTYRGRPLNGVDALWSEEIPSGDVEAVPVRVDMSRSVSESVMPAAAPVVTAAPPAGVGDAIGEAFGDGFGTGMVAVEDADSAVVTSGGLMTGGMRPGCGAMLESAGGRETQSPQPVIQVKPWDSKAPYMEALKVSDKPYDTYMKLKAEYGAAPGYYLDCTDFFASKGDKATALLVLSNLVEMELENRSLLRTLGYKLRYLGDLDQAEFVFWKVAEMFREEPQSYRDLAMVLAEKGEYQSAVDMLRKILTNPMQERFTGVEQIALMEMNRLIAKAKAEGKPVNVDGLDPAFIKPVDTDLRVVINWDTDASDMDLWVTDPFKEKCFYSHNRTQTGGMLSRDVTQGYGPEEFLIRKAKDGDYKIETHYYGSGSQKMLAPVTLYAEVYTDYGRPEEKRQTLFFRLEEKDQVVNVGKVAYGQDPAAPAVRDYQVKKGDTLESIARKELDDVARAEEILKLNPSLKGRNVSAGELIKLPK